MAIYPLLTIQPNNPLKVSIKIPLLWNIILLMLSSAWNSTLAMSSFMCIFKYKLQQQYCQVLCKIIKNVKWQNIHLMSSSLGTQYQQYRVPKTRIFCQILRNDRCFTTYFKNRQYITVINILIQILGSASLNHHKSHLDFY